MMKNKAYYTTEAEKALTALTVVPEGAEEALITGRKTVANRIRSSMENGAYATLRHLLCSYHNRRAIQENRREQLVL